MRTKNRKKSEKLTWNTVMIVDMMSARIFFALMGAPVAQPIKFTNNAAANMIRTVNWIRSSVQAETFSLYYIVKRY